ncbi:hypothetical protein VNI00_012765 [Paramarasmius palmivorus]|uniref:Uncharacterized protein n=1 Tax=Paramarasmius palmivorus TaxID=297713 RepID=A0AAW0C7C6_9AGAR
MSYYNPLHTTIPAHQVSSYSTLGSAVPASNPSQARRVPQTAYAPSGKWRASVGRVQPLNRPINFDYIGYPMQGMPMKELCVRGPYAMAQMMQGANDHVLAHTQLRKITLHIRWPGYEHVEWIRNIEVVTASGPITRAQLAHAVAQNFVRYVEKTQYESTNVMEWRIGPAGILFEHLVLNSLQNVFEDAWQAETLLEHILIPPAH